MNIFQKLFGKREPQPNVSDDAHQQAHDDRKALAEMNFMFGQQLLNDEQYERAFDMFKMAAENGNHADSQFNLAIMCQRGMGTEKNIYEAIRWYEAAANNGDEKAMYNLGAIYHDGAGGLEPNAEKYFYWMRLAAQKGNNRAMHSLIQRITKAIQDITRDLKLGPQWIADNQFFQVNIPNPQKPEDDGIAGVIKVDSEIVILSIYPFGAVSEDLKQNMKATFAEINKQTHVATFGVNDDNQIYAKAVSDTAKMIAEADNFEELVQMLQLFIDTAAGESMWLYNKLLGD